MEGKGRNWVFEGRLGGGEERGNAALKCHVLYINEYVKR